jgi:SET domain-containing protein
MLKAKKSRLRGVGKGLFTTSAIRKGDVIVEYKGELMSWEKCEKRYGDNIDKAKYLFFITNKKVVDAERTPEALARYANDANGLKKQKGLNNNSEYDVIKGKPYIVATRNIKAREEIFVDYQQEYWESIKM